MSIDKLTEDELDDKFEVIIQVVISELGKDVANGLLETEFLNELTDVCYHHGIMEEE